jgi:uncharacterized protein
MVNLGQIQAYMRQQLTEDKDKQYATVSGATLEDALREASVELSLPIKKIEYEILEKGSPGVLGVGRKPFLILAYPQTEREVLGEEDSVLDMDFGFEGEEASQNQPGRALVRLTPDGVLLRVTKPTGSGARVTEKMTVEKIRQRTDATIDTGAVAKIVRLADGQWVRVADLDYDPAKDAILSVEITDSEMKAVLTALPPGAGGTDPDRETLLTFLENNGVVAGVKEDVVDRFVDAPTYREPVLVAEGTKPVNGRDARIVYNFETDPGSIKLKETDGKVNFKELNLVQNVVEGQVLAKKNPPEQGQPGTTVTGTFLPAKDGSDVPLQVGKNVKLSEDKRTAIAEINGQVTILAGKLNVEPIYVINGDVNLKTGNILFLGTVLVKGSVDDGFDIKAAGNIEVMGSVGRSNLDAEGDIIVHQGIAGKNGALVRCGRNLWSKFIENCKVESGDLVVVSDGIINSEVFSNRKVICKGKRASIVGGNTRAAEEVNAKTLGSVAGAETLVAVGYDPKTKAKLGALQEKQESLREELDDVNRNLGSLENVLKMKKKLSEEKMEYFQELQSRKKTIQEELVEAANETEELNSYLQELSVTGKISASNQVYPGTKIYIKDAFLEVRNEFKAVTFVSQANTVKVTKYEESQEDISVQRS